MSLQNENAEPSFWESAGAFGADIFSEALAIKSQHLLNDMRDDAGMARPQATRQVQPMVGPGGENQTQAPAATSNNLKTWLMVGGGILLLIVVVMVLMPRGRR